jgi:hypothetical protein
VPTLGTNLTPWMPNWSDAVNAERSDLDRSAAAPLYLQIVESLPEHG